VVGVECQDYLAHAEALEYIYGEGHMEKKVKIQLLMDASLVERLDEWRTRHMPLRPRSEAIRRFVEMALGSADRAQTPQNEDEGGELKRE
jgi:hypothetical protein